jgi:hypothetical protein
MQFFVLEFPDTNTTTTYYYYYYYLHHCSTADDLESVHMEDRKGDGTITLTQILGG